MNHRIHSALELDPLGEGYVPERPRDHDDEPTRVDPWPLGARVGWADPLEFDADAPSGEPGPSWRVPIALLEHGLLWVRRRDGRYYAVLPRQPARASPRPLRRRP